MAARIYKPMWEETAKALHEIINGIAKQNEMKEIDVLHQLILPFSLKDPGFLNKSTNMIIGYIEDPSVDSGETLVFVQRFGVHYEIVLAKMLEIAVLFDCSVKCEIFPNITVEVGPTSSIEMLKDYIIGRRKVLESSK